MIRLPDEHNALIGLFALADEKMIANYLEFASETIIIKKNVKNKNLMFEVWETGKFKIHKSDPFDRNS